MPEARYFKGGEKMDPGSLKVLMCEIPQFDKLDSEELDIMATHVQYRKIPKGTILVEEGAFGNALFYIINGKIEIRKEALSGHQAVLAQFSKGASVGEMALIEERSQRSATATAIEDSEVLILKREKFNELKENYPKMALKIMQNIASAIGSRLRYTSGRFADIFQ